MLAPLVVAKERHILAHPTDKYRQRPFGVGVPFFGSPLWEGLRRALLQPVAELSMAGGAGGVSAFPYEGDANERSRTIGGVPGTWHGFLFCGGELRLAHAWLMTRVSGTSGKRCCAPIDTLAVLAEIFFFEKRLGNRKGAPPKNKPGSAL